MGKRVVHCALQRGHQVVGIDLAGSPEAEEDPNFTLLQADLTNYEVSLNAIRGCEGIVHLAGP